MKTSGATARRDRPGMTVTEMLVVIAIIGTLMALLLPAVQWARERGRLATCGSQLKQIGIAFQRHNENLGSYPHAGLYDPADPMPPWSYPDRVNLVAAPGRNQEYIAWGWAYQILPFTEKEREFKMMSVNNASLITISTGDPTQVRMEAVAAPIAEYFCPTRRRPVAVDGTGCGIGNGPRGALDYAGNGGYRNKLTSQYDSTVRFPAANSAVKPDGTVVPPGYQHPMTGFFVPERDRPGVGAFPDGPSSTILVGERRFNYLRKDESLAVYTEDNGFMAGYTWDTIRWGYDIPARDYGDPAGTQDTRFGSAHTSGCNFVFADGAVKLLKYNIDLAIFQALCSRDDNLSPTIP